MAVASLKKGEWFTGGQFNGGRIDFVTKAACLMEGEWSR